MAKATCAGSSLNIYSVGPSDCHSYTWVLTQAPKHTIGSNVSAFYLHNCERKIPPPRQSETLIMSRVSSPRQLRHGATKHHPRLTLPRAERQRTSLLQAFRSTQIDTSYHAAGQTRQGRPRRSVGSERASDGARDPPRLCTYVRAGHQARGERHGACGPEAGRSATRPAPGRKSSLSPHSSACV